MPAAADTIAMAGDVQPRRGRATATARSGLQLQKKRRTSRLRKRMKSKSCPALIIDHQVTTGWTIRPTVEQKAGQRGQQRRSEEPADVDGKN
eukprot:1670597-Amphidinium_carterae.1